MFTSPVRFVGLFVKVWCLSYVVWGFIRWTVFCILLLGVVYVFDVFADGFILGVFLAECIRQVRCGWVLVTLYVPFGVFGVLCALRCVVWMVALASCGLDMSTLCI